MLAIVEAPAPGNFTVTTADSIVFDLSWTEDSPSLVKFYRLYNVDVFLGVVLIDTTAATSAQVDAVLPIPDLVFGVSAVSTGNVESRIVFGSAQ